MDLYILRHGIAEEQSKSGQDHTRALTDEGRRKTCHSGKALKEMGVCFDLILTSPFARALQTQCRHNFRLFVDPESRHTKHSGNVAPGDGRVAAGPESPSDLGI